MKKITQTILVVLSLVLFCRCSGDGDRIKNAKFEIEQGNLVNAKKYLESIKADSPHKAQADSLLETLKHRN